MSTFTVDTGALRDAAARYTSAAAAAEQTAAAIQDPDSMMLGIFLEPVVAAIGPMVTSAVRGIVSGTATMDTAYAANLSASASAYDTVESSNVDQVTAITEELDA